MRSIFLALLLLVTGLTTLAQGPSTKIDLATQVKGILAASNGGTGTTFGAWQPPIFVNGVPSSGQCTSANYNQLAFNNSVIPYLAYVCTSIGWVQSGGNAITSFAAPSADWPAWLVPTVTNSTTTPSLAVSASAIPNSALLNPNITINSVLCTLGGSCTVAGGNSVSVNGTPLSTVNFNNNTPSAAIGAENVSFNISGNNVSGTVTSPYNSSNTTYFFSGDSYLVVSSSCLISSPTTSAGAITDGSISAGLLTATATNSLIPGDIITLGGFSGGYVGLNGQVVTIISGGGTVFTANVTGGLSGSTGTGAWGCTYSIPGQVAQMPSFKNHGTVIAGAVGGSTTASLVADYASLVHPYSPAQTGNPGILYVMIGENNFLSSGCSLSNMQSDLTSYWATAHADGWTIVQILEPVINQGNIYCPNAYSLALQWQSWLAVQGILGNPSQATGQYWDYDIDISQALSNNTDSNVYIVSGGDSGHFTDGGAKIVAGMLNLGNASRGSVAAPAIQNQVGNSTNFALLQNQNGAVVGNGYVWSDNTNPGNTSIGINDYPDYTDTDNLFLGNYAMRGPGASQTGNTGNVVVGNYALYGTGSSGNKNTNMTVVGEQAAYNLNGNANTDCELIGFRNVFNLSHCTNAILIGHDLGYPGDNVIQFGDTSNTALVIPAVRSAAGTVPLQVDTGGNITPDAAQAPQFKQYAYAAEGGTNVTSATSNSITVASGDFVFVICKNMTGTVTDTLGSTWHALANLSTTAVTSSAAWAVPGSSGSDAFTCTMTTGTTSSTSVLAVDYAGTLGTINKSATNVSSGMLTSFASTGVTTTGRSLVLFCTAVSSNNSEFTPGYLAGYPAVLRGQSQSGLALGSDSGCADAAVSTAVPNWLASMSYGTAQYWTGYVLAVNY